MSPYWSPLVHSLTPYVPGEQPKLAHLVKLNTNENPYPPSPKAIAAIRREIGDDGAALRLYPDPNADSLKQAIAEYFAEFGVSPACVFVGGNGSDEVLAHIFMALLKHDRPVLLPDISYSFYPVYCGLHGIEHVAIPLDERFAIRVDDYARENGGIVIANPNAPTGHPLPLADIERLAAGSRSVVVVDEAYIDFGGETAIGLTRRFPNLLVARTLSKSHALAGLRIGYAVGDPALIEALERIKNSFNSYPLDRLAIVGATAALSDREYLEKTRQTVIRSRTALAGHLERLGFEVLPSAANFVFVRHSRRDAAELAGALRQRSIIVRHFRQPQRIDQYLRITVGTDAQCDCLVAALQELLQPTSTHRS
jgi:histidinol-phosphate aminotransferase